MSVQKDPQIPLSILEYYLLGTLRDSLKGQATISDFAHLTALPAGTIRFGLQWLQACQLVRYDGDRYHLCIEADTG